ncbi:MAG: 2-oxoacid:acceptor oxidoreductase family protein, partial [Clostridia bacterium]|nr:2-oxoacid:acceptor oxidoreductase family protein [Clostridia bacterium]
PDVLIAMNLPSLDKYEDAVVPSGVIFVDSALIERKVKRTDVKAFYIPATRMAQQNGIPTLANMIMLGKVMRECGFVSYDGIEDAVRTVVSAKHADLYDVNLRAIELGHKCE